MRKPPAGARGRRRRSTSRSSPVSTPRSTSPPAWSRRCDDWSTPESRPRQAKLIPDALLDKLAFAGTPEDVARQAAALYEAGAARVEFGTPHGLTPRRGIELLAERVVPGLRS